MKAVAQASPQPAPKDSTYASMVRRLSSPAALWVAAVWSFAEATVFFIVPDVWLGFVALYAPRRMLVTLAAIVAGSLAGAVVLYLATLALGEGLSATILALPGIAAGDLDQARAELAGQGAAAFLNGILQALPVKVYIHGAALDGIGLPEVVAFTGVNRVERMLVLGLVLALVGWVARPMVSRWPRAAAALYALAWIIFYAGFWFGTGA